MVEGSDLTVAPGAPSKPYLVFTSAGDRSNLHRWLRGPRDFDLWVTYYGDYRGRYASVADIYNCRKGSKFQNLHHASRAWAVLLSSYESIMVMDDDILIRPDQINRLFRIRQELDLWVLQPAFSPWGKITHPITAVQRTERWRYTNFVEMTCPLFRGDKLAEFLEVYDPTLTGHGTDWWFLDVLGKNIERRVAVIDELPCINPKDRTKGGQREIDRLRSTALRIADWERIRLRYNIQSEQRGQKEYDRVPKPVVPRILGQCLQRTEDLLFPVGRVILRALRYLRR